ncbi:MAG: 4-hydroxythreonine-4-phosphate dehydrogenase PdxA [Peptoniphilaceae bacterium]|nr:4-hydroxythreonine-4-phosphate dehydrogenase PdxA [Peptoniphilaceae bacterium]MDD7433355.1 4-hydroxythreonine-4-phosphate dehydrogenase PdxA [Peptoniphilaceae bacterium]MDY3076006.1 4-hydroxythreonine-4-phosphate dehydrogenase PdxA [Peptoniphilaceae bacterium]MDY4196952.1 4-hydroxythreonine-4-phosphate dehydrogenase PdxA [Peptoniphilaceae bacterium]MDY5841347.1 4-hydroxythreonine-4-phosphate dehydrogenase PdxA [Peptoniphilaceae bacterium]
MSKLLISMGDPAGVGPEISLKALDVSVEDRYEAIIIGSSEILQMYHKKLGLQAPLHIMKDMDDFQEGSINAYGVYPYPVSELEVGRVTVRSGDAAFRYVEAAIQLVQQGKGHGVVTAPINKEAIHLAGHNYDGHTEIFASMTGTKDYAMMLWTEKMAVVHNSTHCSLIEACRRVKKDRVHTCVELAGEAMKRLGKAKPRIAVAGLNPHSSEHGLFGDEEEKEIEPAIEWAHSEGWNVDGPVPPDTVFMKAYQNQYDVVVAMYHDQGHIPMKLIAFDSGVNMTLGLPFLRTSVDHGTAFDIAGKGIAKEESMLAALSLARQFV